MEEEKKKDDIVINVDDSAVNVDSSMKEITVCLQFKADDSQDIYDMFIKGETIKDCVKQFSLLLNSQSYINVRKHVDKNIQAVLLNVRNVKELIITKISEVDMSDMYKTKENN